MIRTLVAAPALGAGCTPLDPEVYRAERPPLDLFRYFDGTLDAWGQFEDRSGKVVKRFVVLLRGTVQGDRLTLEEDFVYSDGTKERRVWTITRTGDGAFRSRGESTQKELSFEVRAASRAAVEQLHSVVRDALPGLFDCRRRAGKKASPEGELSLVLNEKGSGTVTASSVASERAPACVASVLKRTLGKARAAGEIKIRFSP